MKCLKSKSGVVIRVSDEEAEHLVRKGDYQYCPKSVWKKYKNISYKGENKDG